MRLFQLFTFFLVLVPFFLIGQGLSGFILPTRKSSMSFRAGFAFLLGVPAGTLLAVPVVWFIGARLPGLIAALAGTGLVGIALSVLSRQFKGAAIYPTGGEGVGNDTEPPRFFESLTALLMTGGILLLAVLPLWHVGFPGSEGYAYRAYFSSDYLKHFAITEEIARFQFPPLNPYFCPEPLHYYWLFYVLPALAVAAGISAKFAIIGFHLVLDGAFLAVLWGVIVSWSTRSAVRLWIYGFLLFATSVEGAYLVVGIGHGLNGLIPLISRYNIDGLSRWLIGHPQFDCLYRAMIYTPQHLLALAFFIMILWLDREVESALDSPILAIVRGTLAGFAFLWSAILGIVVILWVGWMSLLYLGKRPFSMQKLSHLSLVGLPMAAAVGLSLATGMTVPGGSPLIAVWLNPVTMVKILGLNFGFLFLGGVLAVFLAGRELKRQQREFFFLLLALPFGMLVEIKDFPSDIGLKTGLGILIALAGLSTAFLNSLFDRSTASRPFRISIHFLLACALLMALPTVLIDTYNSSDINNRAFTVMVKSSEMEACRWIRRELPPDAIVQTAAETREDRCSIVPTFAGRRSAVGDTMHSHIFQTPLQDFLDRRQTVSTLFCTWNPIRSQQESRQVKIDYLFLGELERSMGVGAEKFKNCPQLFQPVYDNAGVTIFRVKPKPATVIRSVQFDPSVNNLLVECVNPDQVQDMAVWLTTIGGDQKRPPLPLENPASSLIIPAGRLSRLNFSLAEANLRGIPLSNLGLAVSFPIRMDYLPESLRTLAGGLEESGRRSRQLSLLSEEASGGMVAVSSAEYLPPGNYEVNFAVTSRDLEQLEKSLPDAARCEVHEPASQRILAENRLDLSSLASGNSRLVFSLDSPHRLEFRVRRTDNVVLEVRQISIHGEEPPVIFQFDQIIGRPAVGQVF